MNKINLPKFNFKLGKKDTPVNEEVQQEVENASVESNEQDANETNKASSSSLKDKLQRVKDLTDSSKTRALSRSKKPTRKEIFMVLIPALIIANILGIIYILNIQANITKLDQDYIRYYYGDSFVIDKGTKLVRTSDGISKINFKDNQQDATALPMYSEDNTKIFLPENMCYYSGRSIDAYQTDYFSTIVNDKEIVIYDKKSSKHMSLAGGFLFDGDSIYIFLEQVKVKYDGYEIVLNPLSYVEILDGVFTTIYNCGVGEEFCGEIYGTIEVEQFTGDYTMSLKAHSIVLHNGTMMLLWGKPTELDPIWRLK